MEKEFSRWQIDEDGLFRAGKWLEAKHYHVILIENMPMAREGIIDLILRGVIPGIEPVVFENGHDAWNYIENLLPDGQMIDLIITDHRHGGYSGLELVDKIRERELLNTERLPIPIVMFSMGPPKEASAYVKDGRLQAVFSKEQNIEIIIEFLNEIL